MGEGEDKCVGENEGEPEGGAVQREAAKAKMNFS
jgi:hypothetical protein